MKKFSFRIRVRRELCGWIFNPYRAQVNSAVHVLRELYAGLCRCFESDEPTANTLLNERLLYEGNCVKEGKLVWN